MSRTVKETGKAKRVAEARDGFLDTTWWDQLMGEKMN